MKLTTPHPPIDLQDVLPELSDLRRTTVRLHPRKGSLPDRWGSKIGGTFLWPEDEPWPTCDEPWPQEWTSYTEQDLAALGDDPRLRPFPLVPVLQLRAEDVPELPFPRGMDLFQLLWCPLDHNYAAMPKPFVFWRNTADIRNPREEMPEPLWEAIEDECGHVPEEYTVNLEPVTEYPPMELWPQDRREEIYRTLETACARAGYDTSHDQARTLYEQLLSVCPGSKVGGHPFWILGNGTPRCDCGRAMEHLLTLSMREADGHGSTDAELLRWIPREEWDRYDFRTETEWGFGSGKLYLFICRACPDWPILTVSQH